MQVYGSFPAVRMRRMRRDEFSRRLMREHVLNPDDLIYPVFVIDGKGRTQAVPSMPGVSRYTSDKLMPVAERCRPATMLSRLALLAVASAVKLSPLTLSAVAFTSNAVANESVS